MTYIVDIVNAIVALSQDINDFFSVGIYHLLTQFTAWFIRWYMVGMWTAKLALLTFSWDVAQELISSLNLSVMLQTAWSSLESRTLSMLVFFRVPEAVNIILSAAVTKFVFRFLGF